MLCLGGKQMMVLPLQLHQLCVRTDLRDSTVFKNDDLIRRGGAGKAM